MAVSTIEDALRRSLGEDQPSPTQTTSTAPGKTYARPPGMQTMTPEQEAHYRKLQEVRALRARSAPQSGYKYQD